MITLRRLILAAAISSVAVSGLAQDITVKLADVLPTSHSWNIAAAGFAKDVENETDGRVKINLFPNAQLGNEGTLVQGLQIGSIGAGIIGCGSFQPLDKRFGIVELPYAWNNRKAAYAAYDGELGQSLAEIGKKHSIDIISWWENGYREMTNNEHPITKPEDLKGLKIRVTPDKMRLETFKALGASPAPLPFSELYSALQQGVFNAQENPLAIIYGSSFFEVQKYLSLTNHIWDPACLTFSASTWNQISDKDKKTIRILADKWRDKQRTMTQDQDKKLIGELEAKGMKVNKVDIAPFKAKVQSVWNQYQSIYGKKLFELINKYNKENS